MFNTLYYYSICFYMFPYFPYFLYMPKTFYIFPYISIYLIHIFLYRLYWAGRDAAAATAAAAAVCCHMIIYTYIDIYLYIHMCHIVSYLLRKYILPFENWTFPKQVYYLLRKYDLFVLEYDLFE